MSSVAAVANPNQPNANPNVPVWPPKNLPKIDDKKITLRIDKARWWALANQPFYGALASNLTDVLDKAVFWLVAGGMVMKPTACTNGRRIVWNVYAVNEWDDEELRFVLLHETLHCAHQHLWRLPKTAEGNMAGDFVINLILSKIKGIKMPKVGLIDPQYEGMAEEEVLYRLQQHKKQGGGQGGQGCFPMPGGQSPQASGMPGTDMGGCGGFEEPDETPRGGKQPGGKTGEPGGKTGGKAAKRLQKPQNATQPQDSQGQGQDPNDPICKFPGGPTDPNDPTAEDFERSLKDDWTRAVQQAEIQARLQGAGAGTFPADLARMLKRVRAVDIDWYRETIDFAKDAVATKNDWTRSNRRHAMSKVIVPRKKITEVGTIVFYRDTSGSISLKQGSQHRACIDAAMAETKCAAIVIDSDAGEPSEESVVHLEPGDRCPDFEHGGGGTEFAPTLKYVMKLIEEGERIAGVVILTDGDNSDDEETNAIGERFEVPTLWIIGGHYRRNEERSFGRTLFMPEGEDFEEIEEA